jgi:hypothetical protein
MGAWTPFWPILESKRFETDRHGNHRRATKTAVVTTWMDSIYHVECIDLLKEDVLLVV